MDRNDAALVEETKALIKEVESGDTAHAAWVAIQDRVKLLAEDRTQAEVGQLLDKGRRWVQSVVRWDAHTSVQSPFARDAEPGRKEGVQNAGVKQVIRERPEDVAEAITKAEPEQRHKIIAALAQSDETHGEVSAESWNATVERVKREKVVDVPKRAKRQGALSTWVDVTGWARQAEDRGKRALEAVKSADEPIPEDLRDDLLGSVDVATAAWELVAATLRGESVGDQAEAFLAEHDNNE